MAELVLGSDLGAMLNELILLAKKTYCCKGDCNDLVATLESIKPLLIKAMQSSDLGNATCKAWLNDLYTLLVQAHGIVGDCGVKRSKNRSKKQYLSSKIQGINCLIQEKLLSKGVLVALNIVQEIDHDDMACLLTAPPMIDQPQSGMQHVPSSAVTFNNDLFKKLKELILSMPLGATKTIGLKGQGGVGKTFLAKMIYNDEDIKKKNDFGLWITIGQDVSISSVYKTMGHFLRDGGVFERDISGRDLEAQRSYLMEAFKQKSALVILDDVWGNCEKNRAMTYWLDICKGKGSITLITTRDGEVLDRVRATERIEVGLLSEEESWKLFHFHAFVSSRPPSHEVKDIAMEICNECKGLPLALEVIGGALWNLEDVSCWKYALSCLKRSESWIDSTSMEEELFDRLKFSYDALSVDEKKCFLYFAAFPENYCVPTNELYSIWQAEELFGPCDLEDTLNIGRMNLIKLGERCLIDLDDDGQHAKIHDIMRDLAMRIIRDAKIGEWAYECQFEPGKVLKTLPKIKETTKRVSFVGTHVMNFDPKFCNTAYNVEVCLLSSFTFDHGSGFGASLPWDFFSGMTSLLYLNLNECMSLKKLPESIKELKSLKHLDLSGCECLEELQESFKDFMSLMHLNLSFCRSLKVLPKTIKELKSLMHLNLRGCASLKELPNSIKEVKSLTQLDLSYCCSLMELPEGIKGLKSLTHLNLQECTSLKELPDNIKELESLTQLNLSNCSSLIELPDAIKGLKSLIHLDLQGCESLQQLPESIMELKSLTHLDLRYCSSLMLLPESIKEIKSLTHLDLGGKKSLEKLPKSTKEVKSPTYVDPTVGIEVPIDEPEEYKKYLKYIKICMDQAQNLTLSTRSLSLRFNNHQCKYLADKLKSVVNSADLFKLKLIKKKGSACHLKFFKLLYALAKEVKDFIERHFVEDGKDEDAWIQAAVSLANVSAYVSAISFDLELWMLVSSQSEFLEVPQSSASVLDVEALFKAEVENVIVEASGDRVVLLKNVKEVQNKQCKTNAKFQLATLLLKRLEGAESNISSDMVQNKLTRLEDLLPSLMFNKVLSGQRSAATLCKATLLGGKVALKMFDGFNNDEFDKEVSIMRGLSHPNIISFLYSGTYKSKCTIIVELMDGDLHGLMLRRRLETKSEEIGEDTKKTGDNTEKIGDLVNDNLESPFDIMEAVNVMLQIGRGMEYLHGKNIVHRDLKSLNILVRHVRKDDGPEYVVAKVADFGTSKMKESTETYSNLTLNQGSTRWMAPEMMEHCGKDKVLNYPFKTDIYSFGMVCFEILTGHIPFPTKSNREVREFVLKDGRPSLPNQCHPVLECLVKRCWSKDPMERPEFVDICAELRHLKYLLLMQVALGEVKPSAPSVDIKERVASTSNTSTIGGIPVLTPVERCTKAMTLGDTRIGPPIRPTLPALAPPVAVLHNPDPHAQSYAWFGCLRPACCCSP